MSDYTKYFPPKIPIENFIEYKKEAYPSGKMRGMYFYKCLDCPRIIKVPSGHKRHEGKCYGCAKHKNPYLALYNTVKAQAHKREIEFDLTLDEFVSLTNIKNCEYCDHVIKWSKWLKQDKKMLSKASNLDRKDNSKGYCIDNIAICCRRCNVMKGSYYTHEEFSMFREIIKLIDRKREST